MTDHLTDEAVKALLDGATPGPLFVVRQNEPPHIWIVQDPETWVHRCAAVPAHTDRLAEQEANAALYAAAPDLARAYLARGEELTRLRADAQAAVALVVEQAADACVDLADQVSDAALTGLPEQARLRESMAAAFTKASHVIRALAPMDGLAMIEALRVDLLDMTADRDSWKGEADHWMDTADKEKDRADRLAADLAAAQAQIEALRGALDDADSALTEAEAILGGEYGDHYGPLCETMLGLRRKIAALAALPAKEGE